MPEHSKDANKDVNSPGSPLPLTKREKRQIVTKLKDVDADDLLPALISAAKKMCKFPAALECRLQPLYHAYIANQSNPKVLEPIKEAMQAYIESEGIKEFQEILQDDFKEAIWPTEILAFLKDRLTIKIKNDPVVQVAIDDGKIYWRVMRSNIEIFNRHKDFDFDNADSWYMTWAQFRLFKNAGKRSSTVAITKKRFAKQFDECYRPQAELVWQELKEKGVLNEYNRLTDAWRACSNTIVLLDTITEGEITTEDVKECLNDCTNDNRKINESDFIAYWKLQYKSRAALIWKQLKNIGYINDKNVVSQKILSIDKFLAGINLSYQEIADAIYAVCNNKAYCETLTEDLPDYTIFREERAPKSWKFDGTVNNVTPKNKACATKLWDVGIYSDLNAHRNTQQEQKENSYKLNYDHVPSADSLKQQLKKLQTKYQTKIDAIEKQIKSLRLKKEKRLAALANEHSKKYSRKKSEELSASDTKIQALTTKVQNLKTKLETLNTEQAALEKENKGHGLLWWSIAIPEKLHHQGETFMQASIDQKQKQDGHFLTDLNAYLNILEARAGEFSLTTTDDVIRALGAFRYLYKQNLKPAQKIGNKYTTGITPYHFFKQSDDKDNIDERFRNGIKKLLIQREGAAVDRVPQKPAKTK